jgi:mobilome CxxCx(11)CxxC protein
LRLECWHRAFNAFGHGYIFDKRANKYGIRINLLKVFGLLVPATVGSTAIGYGYNNEVLKSLIALAIPLTIIQFVISVLAIIYKWDDELSYSFEASQSYNTLHDNFEKLGGFPPIDYEQLRIKYDLLNTEYNLRQQQDSKHIIKEWELRKGMRSSLRDKQRKCVGCNLIPLSMESTDCYVCGRFSLKYKL